MRLVVCLLSIFVLVPVASAVPANCVDQVGLDCVATRGDILAGGVVVPNSGNDFENIVEAAIEIATGVAVDLTLYGKSDDDPGLFSFSNFDTGSNLESSNSGDWELTTMGDLVSYMTVKAANSFIVYSLGASGVSSGVYSTLGILNNGGRQPSVSHISFWNNVGGSSGQVPEPSTVALLAMAFIGLVGLRKTAS